MKIVDVTARATSFPVAPADRVTLGIGTAVKRDAVVVRVTTDEGLVGYGEAHHGRAPGAVAHLVNTTLRELVTGRDPLDVVGAWDVVYRKQLGSHGMGAAAAMATAGSTWRCGTSAARPPAGRCTPCSAAPTARSRPTRAGCRWATSRRSRSSTRRSRWSGPGTGR